MDANGFQAQAPKKRWWIPVIIIVLVLAIIAAGWMVFGDSIKSLFLSVDQKWQKAEKSVGLISEESLLSDIRSSSEDLLGKNKIGYETDFTFDIKADALPDDMAGILTTLTGMRLNVVSKMDFDKAEPHFYTRIALGKRGESAEALSAEVYDAGDYLLITVPEILPKPLAVHKDFLTDTLDDSAGLGLNFDDTLGSMSQLRSSLQTFSSSALDEIVDAIKDIFIKYANEAELVKGEVLSVGSVSQKLDYYDVSVPSEEAPAMLREMLIYLRDSEDIKTIISDMEMIGISEDDSLDPYAEFVGTVNDLIENIDENPDDFKVEVQRKLYVDSKNSVRGGEFIFRNLAEGEAETLTLSSLHVMDGNEHAQQMKLEGPDGLSLEYLSEYTLENELYTGTFSVSGKEGADSSTEVFQGSFSDFGLQKAGQDLYPVGTLNLEINDLDESMDVPGSLLLKYEAKVEGDELIANLDFDVDAEGSPVTISVGINLRALAGSELNFTSDVPSDFVDLTDENALTELMMDESIMQNLMSALEELGIDLSSFLGF
ncbi:MAG: hypothetical protein PHV73_04655 [Eubacteriales bacterium]|nr:hypothetical protein [Eubacteriales bacterium]